MNTLLYQLSYRRIVLRTGLEPVTHGLKGTSMLLLALVFFQSFNVGHDSVLIARGIYGVGLTIFLDVADGARTRALRRALELKSNSLDQLGHSDLLFKCWIDSMFIPPFQTVVAHRGNRTRPF